MIQDNSEVLTEEKAYLKEARAIWKEWEDLNSESFEKGLGKYNRMNLYALGKQPVDQYKPQLGIDEKDNKSWMVIDMTPLPVLSKLIRIINSIFRKIDMRPDVNTIDPFSEEDKKDYFAEEKANIDMRQILGQVGASDEILDTGDPTQPKTNEELEIKRDFGWKHNLAIKMEQGISHVFNENEMPEEREKTRSSLIIKGAGGYKIWSDPKTGKISFRSVDISRFITSPTFDPYMRDIWYAGEVMYVRIDEIRKITGGRIPERDLEALAMKAAGSNGNTINYTAASTNAFPYDSTRVAVLDISFKKTGSVLYEKRSFDNGNYVIGKAAKKKRSYDQNKREYFDDKRCDTHKVKWIVDSEYVYDYGRENDMVKKASRYWDSALPYIMCAPGINNMETTSIIEELMPLVDAIHIAWYKLQNVIAQARPRGVRIDIGALETIDLTGNGETASPIEIMDLYNKRGILVFRRVAADGSMTNYSPIEELDNGLGSEAAEYYNIIDKHFSVLRGFIGLNDVTDGSTPDPKTLNGVASMAAEATNNALHHIFDAERSLLERVADNVVCRLHDTIAFRESSYYDGVLGKDQLLRTIKKQTLAPREYGTIIKIGPDAAEKQRLAEDISFAIQSGQITLADKYVIINIDNVKQAQQVLAYRIKKNAEEGHERKMEEINANNQGSAQAAQLAENEKRTTLQLEAQLKERLEMIKGQLKEKQIILQGQVDAGKISNEKDGKKEIQEVANDGLRDTANIKAAKSVA